VASTLCPEIIDGNGQVENFTPTDERWFNLHEPLHPGLEYVGSIGRAGDATMFETKLKQRGTRMVGCIARHERGIMPA
jgi:hypothetical protein